MWGISESVLVRGDRVFSTPAGANGLMVAHDKRTGEPLWATPALDGEQASYSSPILINNRESKAAGQRRHDLCRRPAVRIKQPRHRAWLGNDQCGDWESDAGERFARRFVDLRRGAVLLPDRDGHHDSAGTDEYRLSDGRLVPVGRRQ